MGTASLTHTLTPGTNENVSHVQQNFVDLRDFLNSGTGIGTNNLAILPACRVRRTTNQSITSTSTSTFVTFDAERLDTDSMWEGVTNPSRITFTTGGVYAVTGHVRFASNAVGSRYVSIRLNSTTDLAFDVRSAVNGEATIVSVTTIYSFAAADFINLMVAQTSGGNLNVETTAAYSPELAATFLTRAS